MESKERTHDQAKNIIIVGMRLNPSSRDSTELLTWTMAKFANPGDTVVALHVKSSSPFTDSARSHSGNCYQEVASVFDSVMGSYEGFCSIKQIDLQLKVVSGSSIKKALVEQANAYGATKLILGITNKQSALGTTFSLAKYCSKCLPPTCSVLVIEHGRVTFKKEGTRKNMEGNKHNMLRALQLTVRSKSRKTMHHSPPESIVVPEICSETKSQTIQAGCASSFDLDSKGVFDSHSYQHEIHDLPVSVLHPYKYVPPHLGGLRSCLPKKSAICPLCTVDIGFEFSDQASILEDFKTESPSLERWKTTILHYNSKVNCNGIDASIHSGKLEIQQSERKSSDDIYGSQRPKENSLLVQKQSLVLCEKHAQSGNPTLINGVIPVRTDKEPSLGIKNEIRSAGWPLLHQSISLTNVISSPPKAKRISVVQWALQLPERHIENVHDVVTTQSADNLMLLPCSNCQLQQECVKPMSNISDSMVPQEKCVSENGFPGLAEAIVGFPETAVTQLDKCQVSVNQKDLKISILSNKVRALCNKKDCICFEFQKLEAATCNFAPEKLVGKGGYSSVYQGVLTDGREIAVKCLNTSIEDAEQEFLTEVEIMSSLCHQHIVSLIGYCVDLQNSILVYNFIPQGNLEQSLYGGKLKTVLPWGIRQKVAAGIAEALYYLHDGCTRPVVHRDVKSSNILLSSNFEPQLTDFGLAKWAPTTSTYITCNDVVGTFGYLAPEYFMYGKVNEKTDVYSFGVVLLELITGRQPINTSRPKGQENLVIWAKKLVEDNNLSQLIDPQLEGAYDACEMRNMILAASLCLRQSPQCRPCMSHIVKLLNGNCEELGDWTTQGSVSCREIDEGYDMATYGDTDIRTHLALALLGLDDDVSSQVSTEHSLYFEHLKNPEEYLGGRYSRNCSFD